MAISKQEKKNVVTKVSKSLSNNPVVAVASLQSLPARQFNSIKKKLRGKAEIFVARATLLTRALENGKPQAKEIIEKVTGSYALISSNQDPFQLYRTLKKSRSKTKAKLGQIAPVDLVAPAGETSLTPGPVLTELKQAGISAKIVGTKIVIDRDAVLAKKGEAITDSTAKMLAKLGIEPMEVGLEVLYAWENGTVYPSSILNVDEEKFFSNLQTAYRNAMNLAVFAEIPNDKSMPLIISKAARNANVIQKLVETKKYASTEQSSA